MYMMDPEKEELKQLALKWEKEAAKLKNDLDEFIETSTEVENALDADLAQSIARCEKLEASLLEKTNALESLQQKDRSSKARLIRLEDETRSLQEECKNLRETRTKLELSNDNFEKQVRVLEASVADGKDQLENFMEQVVFLQSEKDELLENEQRLRREIQDLNSDLIASKAKIEKLKTSPTSVVSENDVALNIKDSNKKEVEEANARIAQLEAALNKETAAKKELETALLEKRVNGKSAAHDVKEVEMLRSGLAQSKSRADQLDTELSNLQSQHQALLADNTKQSTARENEEVTSLQDEVESLQKRLEESTAKADREATNLQGQVEALQKQLEESTAKADREATNLQGQVEVLQKQLEESNTKRNALQSKMQQLVKTQQEAEEANVKLAEENSKAVSELHSLKVRQEHDLDQQKVQTLQLEVDGLKLRLSNNDIEHEMVVNVLNKSLDEQKERIETLQFQLEKAQGVIKLDEVRVKELSTLLEGERRKSEEMELVSSSTLPSDIVQLRKAYAAQLKTNSSLLNRLQKMRGNILVCCRIRPVLDHERAIDQVAVDTLGPDECGFYDAKSKAWRPFAFDRVFGASSSQTEICQEMKDLGIAETVVGGTSACIMAYGQTGSGKTFTMDGGSPNSGVNYQTISRIFELCNLLQSSGQGEYSLRMAMVEIYNEDIRDLLGESSVSTTVKKTPKKVKAGESFVWVDCPSLDTVESVLSKGRANRATAATNLNLHSSRSHLILVLQVAATVNEVRFSSQLFLVDLAGSERVSKSGTTEGSRLNETKHINRSLAALGDVLEALDSKKDRHVPFRNSKLTHFLAPAFHGRMVMILTVPPSLDTSQETLFSLQFATRARNIELGSAKRHVQFRNVNITVQQLKDELQEAKAQKSVVENRAIELKRKLHVNEQAMTAIKSEGTKKEDAFRKRTEQQTGLLAKETSELRSKLQQQRDLSKQLKKDIEEEKRKVKTKLKELSLGKNTAERRVNELEKVVEKQRKELLKRQGLVQKLQNQHHLPPQRTTTPRKPTKMNSSSSSSSAAVSSANTSSKFKSMIPKPKFV